MRFVTLIKFTPTGVANIGGTTERAKEFSKNAEAAGVKIQELLWTQGEYDGVILFEAPDNETAAAMMLSASSKGNVQTSTMVAFDADTMDQVLAKVS